jgi:hypothetical protein
VKQQKQRLEELHAALAASEEQKQQQFQQLEAQLQGQANMCEAQQAALATSEAQKQQQIQQLGTQLQLLSDEWRTQQAAAVACETTRVELSERGLMRRLFRLGPQFVTEASAENEEEDPVSAAAHQQLQQLQGHLAAVSPSSEVQDEKADVFAHEKAFNAAQHSLFVRAGMAEGRAEEGKHDAELLNEAIVHRSTVIAQAECAMEAHTHKFRLRVQELERIEEEAAPVLAALRQRLDVLPLPSVAEAAVGVGGEGLSHAGKDSVQHLVDLWAAYVGAQAQVSELKASVSAQQSILLAFKQTVALEEAEVAATTAAKALPAAFDAVEEYLAGVGPARLQRTRKLLENQVRAVCHLLEQVEEARSVVRPTLDAAEALLARLHSFRAAEVTGMSSMCLCR